ncbi:MAG: hypothetical protein Alpg2KO_27420 [Alphaproteobacteria bacterium]
MIDQQGRIKEAEPKIRPERTNDRNIAPLRYVTGMPPFDGFLQPCIQTDLTQGGKAIMP